MNFLFLAGQFLVMFFFNTKLLSAPEALGKIKAQDKKRIEDFIQKQKSRKRQEDKE